MPATSFYKRASAAVIPAVSCLFLFFAPLPKSAHGQEAAAESVVIQGEEIPSAYGAPPGISRTRFSPLLTAYVLPPWTFFFGELYEGDVFRHGPPDHIFTQEVEMGLPYRFGLAAENGASRRARSRRFCFQPSGSRSALRCNTRTSPRLRRVTIPRIVSSSAQLSPGSPRAARASTCRHYSAAPMIRRACRYSRSFR